MVVRQARPAPRRFGWRRVAIVLLALFAAATLLFAAGVLWPLPSLAPVRSEAPLAIIGVSIVDVDAGRVRPEQTVVVQAGRILAAGDATETAVPATAERIDGAGLFLMPALWDMHAHVYAVSPLLELPLYIAYGVTSIRDMQGCPRPGDPFIACPEDKRR